MDEASTITHQVPPGPSVEGETFIHRIPPETLLHIFTFCLPNSDSESITLDDDAEVEDFIMTTAPYNISRVCRPWREFIISSASLWDEFALSLSNPSPRTLDHTKFILSLHIQRSQDLPISLSIKLSGTFDADVTRDIASRVALHQGRWRKIQLLFKRDPSTPVKGFLGFSLVDNDGNPVQEIETSDESLPLSHVASFTRNEWWWATPMDPVS
ncbi:hypothetical protein SCHPADRAFT_482510 [Schizopora paradoxa]|uniref:Uncharacterized protein n=1 Tax=Schizopora paradoxa TaxID=27342 RepID=A0A0H2S2G9_9AGAM|nr:hypothetical protein SCHPADRAFT_482510 [Schizopora paradoxa]